MKGEIETPLPYSSVRGLPQGCLATVDIDRNGKPVTRQNIGKVEFLQLDRTSAQIQHGD
jgi:hypothetical protein